MPFSRSEPPVGPKGRPGAAATAIPRREWTDATAAEECAALETQLETARRRGDVADVRRLEARLRLLGCSPGRWRPGASSPATLAQGAYFLASGLWPLVHMPSFERVTGPKAERWLVRTVGVLVAAVGATLVRAALCRRETPDTRLLAAASAAGLGAIDVANVARGRIPRVYLLDAGAEAALLAGHAWLARARRAR